MTRTVALLGLATVLLAAAVAAAKSDDAAAGAATTGGAADANLPSLGEGATAFFLVAIPAIGFAFGMYWWQLAAEISIDPAKAAGRNSFLTTEIMRNVQNISQKVSDGATAFLFAEYKYLFMFMTGFGGLLYFMLGTSLASPTSGEKPVEAPWVNAFLSLVAFAMGASTSIVSGWIGMRIAVFCNSRTAVRATEGADEGDQGAGFAAAFGLGGSAVACFGRVGGGIFTKAADVGADLVGKVEKNIPEDDARNPGVIADCIGDNVGDIAGMGSDLFGSFGEASCAAFVVASQSAELSASFTSMMYPLLITASGVIVCMGTSLLAATNCGVKKAEDVEPTLKRQLLVSTVVATFVLMAVTDVCLPEHFKVGNTETTKWRALVCVLFGLWSGLFIGYTTEYYTSNTYRPVQEISEACETGAATNIIYGLALGYLSVLPPTIAMASTVYVSYKMADLYGYALAALGVLSTMCIALTIDAYGPISDNAGGFAEMAHMGHEIREVTDALDAAGNTTAAIGKGFAISSAAFVALALYGAYVVRVQIPVVNILDQRVMPGLMIGAMLPYWFSAMTMKSVGIAAMDMVEEIRRQFQDPKVADGTKEPDYNACVAIATQASLRQMVAPSVLVIFSPIVIGVLFGKYTLAGMLPGAVVSGVQMATSSSNTGGAWDNAKKYIERGGLGKGKGKGSPQHAAAVTGDTVGDPLKDTSGPALNILIKLMAIISVVFAPVMQSKMGGILMNYLEAM